MVTIAYKVGTITVLYNPYNIHGTTHTTYHKSVSVEQYSVDLIKSSVDSIELSVVLSVDIFASCCQHSGCLVVMISPCLFSLEPPLHVGRTHG